MRKYCFWLLLLVFFSCKKEEKLPENYLSFKVANDKEYHFSNPTWFILGDNTRVFASDDTDNTQIWLFLPKELRVGTFPIDSTQSVRASYLPQGTSTYVADIGSIEVTLFDPLLNRIEGNFHFSAKLVGPLPFVTNIEAGKFNIFY